MSLASLALRLSVVQALRGRTLAGVRVADSELDALDALITQEATPIIIVSIDEADGDIDKAGLPLLDVEDHVFLLFELAVASRTSIEGRDGAGAESIISIEPTSAGLEASLDILWRQICRALLTPLGGTEWGDLVRRLVRKTNLYQRKRGGDARGTRFASRYYLLSLDLIADPDFGREPEGVWLDFLDALAATEYAELAKAIRAEIERPDGLANWRVDQARLGLPEEEIRALGIAPPWTGDPEAPVDFAGYDLMSGHIDTDRADIADGPIDEQAT